ncbi:MAG: FMN-binding negative transcriptional regulator [Hasllibacter sp.]
MHPNPAFRAPDEARDLAHAARRGFGVLAANGDGAPLLAHVPFVMEGRAADLHLVRSNPLARALPARATLIVAGPDGYVSPDWYGTPDQVPTWNYVAIHLTGRLARLPDGALRAHLDALSARFEGALPKRPWTSAKMSPGTMERMMRAIVPARLTIERIESTWKLNQNKPDAARRAAAGAIGGSHGAGLAELAALMRDP